MNEQIPEYLNSYPETIIELFLALRQLVIESAAEIPEERLWAKLPSFYVGTAFVRLIPFKDHINVEARAILTHKDELKNCKLTPKGMLQLSVGKEIPAAVLRKIFSETLNG